MFGLMTVTQLAMIRSLGSGPEMNAERFINADFYSEYHISGILLKIAKPNMIVLRKKKKKIMYIYIYLLLKYMIIYFFYFIIISTHFIITTLLLKYFAIYYERCKMKDFREFIFQ